ncbi:MAG: thiol-disulfide oxidoreductase [Micrococcales bacterium]|nr:MAG: thiol-disulfide oxidoreductase [Micrococcales bacterium]PIE27983.1 MAG: thiol-disulfide oxidoreductase [Micrococcales bacterium]
MSPTLVFDGDCGLCSRLASLARRLRACEQAYRVVAYQQTDLTALGLTTQECAQALQWVEANGRIETGAAAVARLLLAGRWWARPGGALLLLPGVRALSAVAYRWVATHRHRLPGGSAACSACPDTAGVCA